MKENIYSMSLKDKIKEILKFETRQEAAKKLNVSIKTIEGWITKANKQGLLDDSGKKLSHQVVVQEKIEEKTTREHNLQNEIKGLKNVINNLRTELGEKELSYDKLFEFNKFVNERGYVAPDWMKEDIGNGQSKFMGIPTIFASDFHFGEYVNPSEINNSNIYSIDIAKQRVSNLINRSTDILNNTFANANYPGVVFALGGDMVTGDIHEELAKTNDVPTLEAWTILYDSLVNAITRLSDNFGNVFVPCVSGNHGRLTEKIQNKQRNKTNLDWLLYVMLAKHFIGNDRVRFSIPDGPDCFYQVYNHRYLLTHGDQFRGGDGMIGAIGPIIRGDYKKKSRNNQINMSYDTIIMGHWHQYIFHRDNVIVNGSLKGYDEYAFANNFKFERPKQALWFTHPEHGITIDLPIIVDDVETELVSNKNFMVSWIK